MCRIRLSSRVALWQPPLLFHFSRLLLGRSQLRTMKPISLDRSPPRMHYLQFPLRTVRSAFRQTEDGLPTLCRIQGGGGPFTPARARTVSLHLRWAPTFG